MPQRIFIIEQASLRTDAVLGPLLSPEGDFCYERANWDSFSPESLRDCTAQLVLAVAVPLAAEAVSFFRWLRGNLVVPPTLAILAPDTEEELLRAASEAVDDFVFWPIRKEELRYRLVRILRGAGHDVDSVRRRLTMEMGLSQLAGNDPAFVRTIEKIPLTAASDTPVLITGETGTGKELCARAIHHLSKRCNFPFIPVECAAVPDHLFENELFGHARGAFTDAHGDQKGLAAMAEGGSLFLDEIDALSPAAQVKLLRFLEERTYKPLGAERFARADVRMIAATNCDLVSCVREKQFRSDLYFRLNVLRLHLPPLRERRGDIGLLARHFVELLCRSTGVPRKSFSPAALRKLESYDWPGNVRELSNVVQRAVVFSASALILPCDIQLPVSAHPSEPPCENFRQARARTIERFERQYVVDLLHKHRGNITRAAAAVGKDRRAFGRLVKKYGIDRQAL